MGNIQKIAVLGSGVMGSGIAAHVANSGTPVLLLDIVPQGASDRNQLTKTAVERQLKASPAAFTHPDKAKLVTCGNLEDDLAKLKDCDWIIEAVLEKLEIKQAVYQKVAANRKKDAVVSSNTSTIPMHELTKGFDADFRRHFMITHFFNPPRYMRLLEIVTGAETDKDAAARVQRFADVRLGKGLVTCKDTPGFIANRIGVYWLMVALLKAMEMGITVEQADAVMGKPVGIPKTAVFGLFDLIGIDLMPLIAKEMLHSLPESDPFRALYREPELITKMIQEGYTGRKGKGGFYRINKEGGKKTKEVINLQTGAYAPEAKAKLASVEAAKQGLRALLTHEDIGGRYAWEVLSEVMRYAAALVPEIADDIVAVDNAMKWGYAWKYGPFELIDRLGGEDMSGAAWLAARLKEAGKPVPPLLEACGKMPFYKTEANQRQYFSTRGNYAAIHVPQDAWSLADKKLGREPLLKNGSASLWDIGDGVACVEFTSKMNALDTDSLEMLTKAVDYVAHGKGGQKFRGLVIGNDADNFSVGANIGMILYLSNMAAWEMIEGVIKQGQDAMMGLKYAPFPVVGALAGMALGGGCETILHCDAVQAHVEAYTGLVELGVGLIPGWGGCKEMLLRHINAKRKGWGGLMPPVTKAFELIATAKVSASAEEAREMLILNDKSRISMNRARVLADAKQLCLEMAQGYKAPERAVVKLPGATGKMGLWMGIKAFEGSGKASPHDVLIAKGLAAVLTGADTDSLREITEQQILDIERAHFMELIKTRPTLERIEHMLNTGKPLRN